MPKKRYRHDPHPSHRRSICIFLVVYLGAAVALVGASISALLVQQPSISITQTAQPSRQPADELKKAREDITSLQKRLDDVQKQLDEKKKDAWDKLGAVSGLISGIIVAVIGIVATRAYNRRQQSLEEARSKQELTVAQVQTIQTFFPHLSAADERERQFALLAINELGNPQLATSIGAMFKGPGVASALSQIAAASNEEGAAHAQEALAVVLELLRPTIVRIKEGEGGKPRTTGFLANADGLVISTDYASLGWKNFAVEFVDGTTRPAKLKSVDEDFGLCSLTVQDGSFHFLELETSMAEVGDRVICLAYSNFSATGWAARVGRILEIATSMHELSVDLANRFPSLRIPLLIGALETEPGFAGAPLVNSEGRVVGINYARLPDGRVVFIPSPIIKQMFDQLMAEDAAMSLKRNANST